MESVHRRWLSHGGCRERSGFACRTLAARQPHRRKCLSERLSRSHGLIAFYRFMMTTVSIFLPPAVPRTVTADREQTSPLTVTPPLPSPRTLRSVSSHMAGRRSTSIMATGTPDCLRDGTCANVACSDLEAIYNAIAEARKEKSKPTLIRLRTTIGFGSKLQGTHGVHGARTSLIAPIFSAPSDFAPQR